MHTNANPNNTRPNQPPRKPERHPLSAFNPLAPYRGVVQRFFILYRHVLGLMAGGFIAFVDAMPAYKKEGLNSAGPRLLAAILRLLTDREMYSKSFPIQLRLRLQLLGPTYVKLGQIMAIREDILPKNITTELAYLLDRVPAVSFDLVRGIIEDSLGGPLEDLFESVSETPIGSASIGQTHLARTRSGEPVVVKIIKPGIRDTILSDLMLLQILGRFLEWIIPRYQPKIIIQEFCRYTEKETDLTCEADHAEIFAVNFVNNPDVAFPRIYRRLSSKDVLCMEYFQGIKPNDPRVFELSPEERQKIIDVGTGAVIQMLYADGFFHADLHAGNLIGLPGPRVGFIDLGMVGRFEERTKQNMLYYFHALVNGDVEGSARYLQGMAKVDKGGDPYGFKRAVTDLCRRYYLRASEGQFSLAQLIMESMRIGGQYRIFFPVEMTLMVKALVTFEGVGQLLDPNLDIPGLSRKHIGRIYAARYHPKMLARQFARGLPEMVDVMVRFPELISDGSRYFEDVVTRAPKMEAPVPGLRSSILAGSCIIGGVLAVTEGAPPLLWIVLFTVGILLALLGK